MWDQPVLFAIHAHRAVGISTLRLPRRAAGRTDAVLAGKQRHDACVAIGLSAAGDRGAACVPWHTALGKRADADRVEEAAAARHGPWAGGLEGATAGFTDAGVVRERGVERRDDFAGDAVEGFAGGLIAGAAGGADVIDTLEEAESSGVAAATREDGGVGAGGAA